MRVTVSSLLEPYLDAAITRLGYVYPSICFTVTGNCVEFSGADDLQVQTLVKEVNYALYREKIYAETLSMRQALISAVTHR